MRMRRPQHARDRAPTANVEKAGLELLLPLVLILPGLVTLPRDREPAWAIRASILSCGGLHAADIRTGDCVCLTDRSESWLARQFTGGMGSRFRRRPRSTPLPVTDDYFGTKIVDNYRWLEDSKSPRNARIYRCRECLHGALHEAGAHSAAGGGRSGRSGKRLALADSPVAARRQLLLQEAAGGRTAVLHLCAAPAGPAKTSGCLIPAR